MAWDALVRLPEGNNSESFLRCLDVALDASAAGDAGLSVAYAGPRLGSSSTGVTNVGQVDGEALARLVASSRFSLSLLRSDVGVRFSDTHPCRMIEAARLGSMLVSDPLPGLARLFVPVREVILLDSGPPR